MLPGSRADISKASRPSGFIVISFQIQRRLIHRHALSENISLNTAFQAAAKTGRGTDVLFTKKRHDRFCKQSPLPSLGPPMTISDVFEYSFQSCWRLSLLKAGWCRCRKLQFCITDEESMVDSISASTNYHRFDLLPPWSEDGEFL